MATRKACGELIVSSNVASGTGCIHGPARESRKGNKLDAQIDRGARAQIKRAEQRATAAGAIVPATIIG